MNDIVKMFDTKSELPVTNLGVHRLLKYAITDDDDTFDKMEHLGMLLYVMGSHQKQSRALIRNPVEYSRKCEQLPAAHDFKVDPTLKSLKNWWASEIVTTHSKPTAITSTHRRNLLADLGSDTESDGETANCKKKESKSKPQKPPSPSSSSLSSTDDKASPPKQPELHLSFDDDPDSQPGPFNTAVWSPQREISQAVNTEPPSNKPPRSLPPPKKEEKV